MPVTYEILGVGGAPMDKQTAIETANLYLMDGAQAQILPFNGGFKLRITRAD